PVVYRASVAEMMVPYADPGPARFWQNYFDAGEYLLGQQVVSLMLGCDCLGEIRYLDAVLAGGDGEPREVPDAICLHEEDVGVAWKHNDLFTGSAASRRLRRPGRAHAQPPFPRPGRDPPHAAPGHLDLRGHRQLRLRLLLVPVPRRPDRAG